MKSCGRNALEHGRRPAPENYLPRVVGYGVLDPDAFAKDRQPPVFPEMGNLIRAEGISPHFKQAKKCRRNRQAGRVHAQ
jgi:hypothetical protein